MIVSYCWPPPPPAWPGGVVLCGPLTGHTLLLAAISALWMLEDPPLYPPNDVPLDEALSMAGTLLCLAGLFTPSNRQRIARVARGFASRHLPALPVGRSGMPCVVDAMIEADAGNGKPQAAELQPSGES